MKKTDVQHEAKIMETHTMALSFSSSESPIMTVTTSYEFGPNSESKFGVPVLLEQD